MVKIEKSHAVHLLLSLLLLGSIAEAAGPIAIRGGTVLTVSGDPIEDGTVLIADGKIRAVGRDVVVIGAGRSGLATMRRLAEAGAAIPYRASSANTLRSTSAP